MSNPQTLPPFPWTVLASREVYDNPWLRVIENDVRNARGRDHLYTTVHIKRIATGVVALHADGTVALVGQHRFPLRLFSWEVPEGGCEPGEAPLVAIQRELKEEAGITAGQWRQVLTLHLSNMLLDEVAYGYLATDLTQGAPEPEETEFLVQDRVPFRDVLERVIAGEITDAISVALILRVNLMAERGELPPELVRAMRGA